jgi:O-acetylserine/cysteine efflux transporter
VSLQTWMTLLGAGILHAVSVGLPSERLGTVSVGFEQIAAIAYLGIVASAIGFLLYFRLISTVGAAETSLVSYAVPAVTAISGWLLLGETLSPVTVAGFAVIVVGFAWVKADVIRSLRRRRVGSPSYRACGPRDDCVVVSGNRYSTQD